MSVFEKVKNTLKDYDVPFLNAHFTIKDGKERIRIADGHNGAERLLPFQACSSGIQSVLPLVMVIDYALKLQCFDSFVIEEPEQNLFPTYQRELLKFLMHRMDLLHNIVITTHSPYMLSCLNVAILANRIISEFEGGAQALLSENYDGAVLQRDMISAYSLNPESDIYCKSLIDENTHLIGINGLDAVSDVIGEEYDKLYHLYLKLKRAK